MIKCKVIYVDGGATSTKIHFCDEFKNIISTQSGPRLNLVAFEKETLANLLEITEILKPYKDLKIYFGIPGIRIYDLKIIKNIFKSQFVDIHFLTDIELQANLLINVEEFNFISLGTGSINLEKKKNSIRLLGGWGHFFGDNGSAFDFGNTWIRFGIIDFENNKLDSKFIKVTQDFFKIKNFEEIKKLYLSPENFKQTISEFSVYVLTTLTEFSKEKELVAKQITAKLAKQLVESNFDANLPFFVSGGLLKSREYQKAFLSEFTKISKDITILN